MSQIAPFHLFPSTVAHALDVPVVFDSPHSGTHYPADFDFTVSFDELRRAEDTHVEKLYAAAPAHGATLIAAAFPRSYIDANRSLLDIDAALLDGAWPGPVNASRSMIRILPRACRHGRLMTSSSCRVCWKAWR